MSNQKNFFLFSLQATEAFLEQSPRFMVGLFYKNKLTAKSCSLFLQKSSTIDFRWVLNTSLGNTVKKFERHFPSYEKLFVSLCLSCTFYFVVQIRKTCYRKT